MVAPSIAERCHGLLSQVDGAPEMVVERLGVLARRHGVYIIGPDATILADAGCHSVIALA